VWNPELETDQKKRIIDFFNQCVTWAKDLREPPKKLLSSLSRLSCYLLTVTEHEQELLLTIAPYVNVNHNFTFLIKELDRLANTSPAEISTVLGKVLESYSPLHDYKDHLKLLLIKLFKAGERVKVLGYAERLRNSLPQLAAEIFSLMNQAANKED
jgi:hypothetical protein